MFAEASAGCCSRCSTYLFKRKVTHVHHHQVLLQLTKLLYEQLQLDSEQDIYNLRMECEEKDTTIKELSGNLHSSEVISSKVLFLQLFLAFYQRIINPLIQSALLFIYFFWRGLRNWKASFVRRKVQLQSSRKTWQFLNRRYYYALHHYNGIQHFVHLFCIWNFKLFPLLRDLKIQAFYHGIGNR